MVRTKAIYPIEEEIIINGFPQIVEDCYHNNDQCTGYKVLKESGHYKWGAPDTKDLCKQCKRLNKSKK